jgi:hypothetical protein
MAPDAVQLSLSTEARVSAAPPLCRNDEEVVQVADDDGRRYVGRDVGDGLAADRDDLAASTSEMRHSRVEIPNLELQPR